MTDREAITMLEGSACTPVMRKAINKGIKALKEREERSKPQTPCDLCAYNPPSSGDGKPCSMCPAMLGEEV